MKDKIITVRVDRQTYAEICKNRYYTTQIRQLIGQAVLSGAFSKPPAKMHLSVVE